MDLWRKMMEGGFLKNHLWLVNILIIILSTFLVLVFFKVISAVLKKKIKKEWVKNIDHIFFKPLYFLVYSLAVIYVLAFASEHFGIGFHLGMLKNIVATIFFTIALLRWKNVLAKKEFKKIDEVTVEFINRIFSIVIFFISFLIILEIVGINIMPIIAFGGVGAAAVGFAAKDVISNFFGGLMIYITKPFKRGDFIEVPKESIVGFVEHVGWYLTCIRNLDKSPVYMPNSIFSTAQIKNHSRRSHRKIEYAVGVRYKDFQKLSIIIEQIKQYLKEDKDIDKKEQVLVFFGDFKEYSLEIFIRAYAFYSSYENFLAVKQRLLMRLKEIISSNGCDIPFPVVTVESERI